MRPNYFKKSALVSDLDRSDFAKINIGKFNWFDVSQHSFCNHYSKLANSWFIDLGHEEI